jgi:protocatechuate 3,4-dioxygenase beta subunit
MAVRKNVTNPKIELTPSVEEGPYYKRDSPERTAISAKDTPGNKLVVEGHVFDRSGHPISHAWLDFWHADSNGEYDNRGYNLRGHQYADKDGHYRLETIKPKDYLFRAPHIHAKVQSRENSPTLTTQLFFPGESKNATDPIFEKLTVMDVKDTPNGQKAKFDFVVEVE